MECLELMVCLQRDTQVLRYIMVSEGNFLKLILTIKYNEIHICHSDLQKNVSLASGINSLNVSHAGSLKFSNTLRPVDGEF